MIGDRAYESDPWVSAATNDTACSKQAFQFPAPPVAAQNTPVLRRR